jgi:small-conductance mechanosensitive channel
MDGFYLDNLILKLKKMDPVTVEVTGLGTYTIEPGLASAIGAFFITIALLRFFRAYLIKYIKKVTEKTKTDLDDLLLELLERVPWSFYILLSIFVGLKFVSVPQFLNDAFGYAVVLVAVYYAVHASHIIIDFFRDRIIDRRKKLDKSDDVSLVKLLADIVKHSMWLVGVLLILSNLGFDINALIAGMGIGGLAIALAAQNVLEDIFASFSIYFDKPYKIGDFIIIGDDLGVVQKIGIKTTRINTLRGEELVVSNRELTSTRIHNFGRMPHRRIDFSFGVLYQTTAEKMRKIPDMVKEIVETQELTRFDRAHFKSFGDSSLDFEVVYYLDSPDYLKYMDTQQAINLGIMEAFEKEGIDFAYPTRTIFIEKE